jgi:hypothetical protein
MAVGYRSSSSTGASDDLSSSESVPVPSGAAANDIALVALEMWEIDNPTVTVPSGFTLVTTVINGSQKLKVFWKRLTGADTGTYNFSWSGDQWHQAQCILFTGVKTTGDPIGANFDTDTATASTAPTTTVSTAFVPGLAHWVANENPVTHTPPSSFTEVQDANLLTTGYRLPGSSGLQSAASAGLSSSTVLVTALVALEPAGGGGSVTLDAVGSAAGSAQGSLAASRTLTASAGAANSAQGAGTVARGLAGFSGAASAATGDLTTVGGGIQRDLNGSVNSAASFSGDALVARELTGSVGAASQATGALTLVRPAWQLVMPTIREKWTLKGSLTTSTYREATVFGDENGLFTTERGSRSEGSDEYGAIPFGTKYIWYGGHVNTTDDPAVKDLWLDAGFEVENV